MGAPKQKWTAEEEAALRAGVDKYGPGKWRAIQKDPKFGPVLASRSNVDLKDKWRNLSACQGSRSSKVLGGLVPAGTGMRKSMDLALSPLEVDPLSVFPDATSYPMRDMPTTSNDNSPNGPRYEDLILEAIATLKQPGGSNPATISSFIEERNLVPANFRRLMGSNLKTLINQGKIVKVDQNNYKLVTGGGKPRSNNSKLESDEEKREKKQAKTKRPRMDLETAEEIFRRSELLSFIAARALVDADEANLEAELAARESERAEAEFEAKEIAVEVAAFHARPHRKPRMHAAGAGALCNPISSQS